MKFVGGLLIVALSLQSQTSDPYATAALIGVLPELKKLSVETDRWQRLALHQQITEQVMADSLQVDAVIAQIDNEIARHQQRVSARDHLQEPGQEAF